MIYKERQLDSFSNPPFKYETNQIIRTKDKIQDALNTNIPNATIKESFNLDEFKYNIYLQGSYKNSTNVTKSSDVDIIVELTSVYYSDISSLNESQKSKYELQRNKSKYRFSDFKNSVQTALVKSFGESNHSKKK